MSNTTVRRSAVELVRDAAVAGPIVKGIPAGISMTLAEVRDLEELGLMAGYSVDIDKSKGIRWSPAGVAAVRRAIEELQKTDDLVDVDEAVTVHLELRKD